MQQVVYEEGKCILPGRKRPFVSLYDRRQLTTHKASVLMDMSRTMVLATDDSAAGRTSPHTSTHSGGGGHESHTGHGVGEGSLSDDENR